jgi:epoxide hydrolase 4
MEEPVLSDGLEVTGGTHLSFNAGEVRLHAVEAGSGPLVVLLHGFPDFWWSWRHQIPALAAAGFHVVAPDLRGYNLSDRPARVADYGLSHLTEDVAGVVRAMGEKSPHVFCHDWGGAIAWEFAMRYPQMLGRLAILNAPHPAWLRQALFRSFSQWKKSAYMLYFQVPLLPERFLAADDFKNLRRALCKGRGRVPMQEIQPYVDAARRADGLRGGLHYYRAMMRSLLAGTLPKPTLVEAPVLVLWGEKDPFLGNELAKPPSSCARDVRVDFLPNASHWVQLEEPERVNTSLAQFLT